MRQSITLITEGITAHFEDHTEIEILATAMDMERLMGGYSFHQRF